MAEKEKNIEFKKAKNQEKKNHNKKTIGWWIGVIVLILISITFVLPSAGIGALFQKDSLVFGSYNGEDIEYAYGNYFFNQFNNLASQAQNTNDMNEQITIWQNAYYNTVYHTALVQMAKEAKLSVSEAAVNSEILKSGYYNNDEGTFDVELYNSTSDSDKANIYNSVEASVLPSIVISDFSTVVSSDAERDFVASLGSNARSFEYAVFNSSSYSDEKAIEYLNSNPRKFTSLDLEMVAAPSVEEADTLILALNNGEKNIEDEETYTSINNVTFNALSTIIASEEDVNLIFSTKVNEFIGPFTTQYGTTIFKVKSVPELKTNDAILNEVKSVIASENAEEVLPYVEKAAREFYNNPDWASANVNQALQVSANPLSSSLFSSFTYADATGVLAKAASNDDYTKTLYNKEVGTVLEPVQVDNSFIVTKITSEDEVSSILTSSPDLYSYFTSSFVQTDLSNRILQDTNYKDNFFNTLLSEVMGKSTI